ncbi:putative leucine--tRNA ligase, mitochondrial [Hypsibius exemplaris]|uniref:leucine--tRNA ligase n=1 Tax=Hypsibius exemplaris TaxID=2072580 RepID=A0A9X6RLZ5_HYPEX|nr:putative leucine--tRNA ligase, mitochondrial [Hypsibius exemplaris]
MVVLPLLIIKPPLTRSGFLLSKSSGCRWIPARTAFNQTGIWEPKLTLQVKQDLEAYWKPILHNVKHRQGSRGKYYVLSMFPYPSGKLHLGHVRVYAISDSMARMRKLQGYEVIHPMGWDAFGLPAENAAVEKGMPAHVWTESNITHMRQQLINMGFDFDWDREVRTCDPAYYRWTQHLFLQLWDAGLVYQKEAFVNWDPVDQTVLANEQVDENGRSWRSGAVVEKKLLKQWFIKTSEYAAALQEGLATVPSNWFDVVDLQRNWIGEITGHRVKIEVWDAQRTKAVDTVSVFTDNLPGLLGTAFLTVPPDHEMCAKHRSGNAQSLDVACRNPLTGEFFPVFVVEETQRRTVGLDPEARFGVPNLNEADADFAASHSVTWRSFLTADGLIAKGFVGLSGMSMSAAAAKIVADGKEFISTPISSKCKDWLISRQRYWGTPIPLVHCAGCGHVPVAAEDLPVKLPLLESISSRGGSLLAQQVDWVNTVCPKCNGPAKRETDTMDTFVDSSWYFLRYLDPKNESVPFSREAAMAGMPVDLYIGGKEHALMHLFYARFIGYFLHRQGLLPQPEPFDHLLSQGFVQGKSYQDKVTGRYLTASEVEIVGGKTVGKGTGNEIVEEWEKMSKSKMNGLDPDDAVAEYGIDATRLFMLGNVAPRSHRRWDPFLFKGLLNWELYLWLIVNDYIGLNSGKYQAAAISKDEEDRHEMELAESRNHHVKEIDGSLDKYYGINMALKKLQNLSTSLRKVPSSMMQTSPQFRTNLRDVITMLFPFAPHFAAELWTGACSVPIMAVEAGHKQVWESDWPKMDETCKLDLIIQLDGERIATVKVPAAEFATLTEDQAVSLAFQNERLSKYASSLGPTDSVNLVRTSDVEATLELNIPEASQKRKAAWRAEKAAKKASRKGKPDAVAEP